MTVLCIRLSALGDVVLTTGVLSWMKTQFPNMKIDFVTSANLTSLLSHEGYLRRVYGLPKGAPKDVVATLARELPAYDFVLDWQDSLRSRQLCRMIEGKTFRIRKQSLIRRLFVRFRWGKDKLQNHVVEKYAQVGEQAFQLPRSPIENLRPQLKTQNLTNRDATAFPKNGVVLHPFASQKNKVWPYFPELCKSLLDLGETVILVGNTTDEPAPEFPTECHNFINSTDLPMLCAILADSKTLITTDSGPMHLGIAVKCPTLAIFGPTTREFGFYPNFEQTRVIENVDLPCRPCHVHGGQICPLEHFRCMKDISTEQVLAKMDELLKATDASPSF